MQIIKKVLGNYKIEKWVIKYFLRNNLKYNQTKTKIFSMNCQISFVFWTTDVLFLNLCHHFELREILTQKHFFPSNIPH